MGTGARIKKRRQELHISQSKLASMAGMSQSGLSTIENEKTVPCQTTFPLSLLPSSVLWRIC